MILIEKALKPGGICYCSWKYGDEERVNMGRRFTDFTEVQLIELFKDISVFDMLKLWITNDVRQEKSQKWINVIIKNRREMVEHY